MSFLEKIIPFYGAIEKGFESLGRMGEEKVHANEERKTLKTKAEMEIYLKTEYEKAMSQIKQDEADKIHGREVERMEKQSELDDLPNKRIFERQTQFEKHRVDLFERVKKLEFNIKKEIDAYDIEEQKKLTQWHNNFMRNLEKESSKALTKTLSEILLTAKQFKDEPDLYDNFKKRAFVVVDKIIGSVETDQQLFREELRKLSDRHEKMAGIMVDMSKKFEIGSFDTRVIENKK